MKKVFSGNIKCLLQLLTESYGGYFASFILVYLGWPMTKSKLVDNFGIGYMGKKGIES